mmetsp:Transcript_25468/g.60746  ORF Transcript_25468/g.60746 Transcript_25468/m.60746 type:complete len:319 (-) Transcript_25468:449-1405(-)
MVSSWEQPRPWKSLFSSSKICRVFGSSTVLSMCSTASGSDTSSARAASRAPLLRSGSSATGRCRGKPRAVAASGFCTKTQGTSKLSSTCSSSSLLRKPSTTRLCAEKVAIHSCARKPPQATEQARPWISLRRRDKSRERSRPQSMSCSAETSCRSWCWIFGPFSAPSRSRAAVPCVAPSRRRSPRHSSSSSISCSLGSGRARHRLSTSREGPGPSSSSCCSWRRRSSAGASSSKVFSSSARLRRACSRWKASEPPRKPPPTSSGAGDVPAAHSRPPASVGSIASASFGQAADRKTAPRAATSAASDCFHGSGSLKDSP